MVTDIGIRAAGILDRVLAAGAAAAPVFDATPANPTEAAVEAALALYRAEGCDGLVAVGGGSPVDLAKGVALLAAHPGPLAGYAAILGGVPRITAATAPVVAVPTTAGTGSEVGARRPDHARGRPQARLHQPAPDPQAALCDPELTLGLPPLLTAATGMDAVTHCVETYLSPALQPAGRGDRAGRHRARRGRDRAPVDEGRDREARREMMIAAIRAA